MLEKHSFDTGLVFVRPTQSLLKCGYGKADFTPLAGCGACAAWFSASLPPPTPLTHTPLGQLASCLANDGEAMR